MLLTALLYGLHCKKVPVQMLFFRVFRTPGGLQQYLGAAVDYQISTMVASVGTCLASFIRGPGRHNDRSETLDYSFTVYSSSINTSYNYDPTHSLE